MIVRDVVCVLNRIKALPLGWRRRIPSDRARRLNCLIDGGQAPGTET
jgi:hypothetical protein